MNTKKVTRLEVIDKDGRVFTYYDVTVKYELQDDDRTLKIFVEDKSHNMTREDRAEQYIKDCELEITVSELLDNNYECRKCGYWLSFGEDCLCWTR